MWGRKDHCKKVEKGIKGQNKGLEYPGDDYEYGYTPSSIGINKPLGPLICQIRKYDDLRLKLEQKGGHTNDLNRITEILSETFFVRDNRYNTYKVTLMEHASIYNMLNDIGKFSIRFNIRQLDTGMPVYYICRTHKDYWAEYNLIVQDIYKSPGYPMHDERFVKLMYAGHEVYYLRLSHFREAMANSLVIGEKDEFEEELDEILYNLGRYVFQAAWHEDQQLGIMVSNHFGLESFRYCIELLYLCLSAELCELRTAVNDQMLLFFDRFYPQPAIHSFLEDTLPNLDGSELNRIPQKALRLYARLSRSFSHFLGTEVIWGDRKKQSPLYKIIYGNFTRLELVGKGLKDNNSVKKAVICLEAVARAIIKEIINCNDQ